MMVKEKGGRDGGKGSGDGEGAWLGEEGLTR